MSDYNRGLEEAAKIVEDHGFNLKKQYRDRTLWDSILNSNAYRAIDVFGDALIELAHDLRQKKESQK